MCLHTLTHVSFDVPPAPRVQDTCVKASERVQEQAGPTTGGDAMDSVKDYELRRSAKHRERAVSTTGGKGFDFGVVSPAPSAEALQQNWLLCRGLLGLPALLRLLHRAGHVGQQQVTADAWKCQGRQSHA